MRLDQLFKEALGRPLVAPLLHQDIEHVTMLIHGTPEIKNLTVDLDHNFIKIPLVARPWPVSPNDIGKQRTKSLLPLMDGLVTDIDAAVGKNVLNIAKAERESVIQPYGMADDLARKTVAFEGIEGRRLHSPHLQRSDGRAKATVPWKLVIVKRCECAFKITGLTWIVERTFAWLGRSRRLSKDYERLVQTSETMIDIATVRMMINKLAPN